MFACQFDSETGLKSLLFAYERWQIEYFCSKAITHLKIGMASSDFTPFLNKKHLTCVTDMVTL
jgi:hypothetical protein